MNTAKALSLVGLATALATQLWIGALEAAPVVADVEVSDVAVTVPDTVQIGANFEVTIQYTVTNLGPADSVNATVDSTLGIPGGCSEPLGETVLQTETLVVSAGMSVSSTQSWTVVCRNPGGLEFRATTQVLESTDAYTDPVAENNFKESRATVVLAPQGLPWLGGSPSDQSPEAGIWLAGGSILAAIGIMLAALSWSKPGNS